MKINVKEWSLFPGKEKKFLIPLPLFDDIEESIKDLGQSAGYDILHFVDSIEKVMRLKVFIN